MMDKNTSHEGKIFMSQISDSDEGSSSAEAMFLGRLSRIAEYSLGIWSFYFIAKLCLYWMELIGFHVWENLAFAAFILVPFKHGPVRLIKQFAMILLAIMLLYYDSWLPAIGRVFSHATLISGFSAAYLFELAGRFVSLPVIALLFAAGLLYWIFSRWIRLDSIVIMVMIAMPLLSFFHDHETPVSLNRQQLSDEDTDWYEQAAHPILSDHAIPQDQLNSPGQPTKPVQVASELSVLATGLEKTGLHEQPTPSVRNQERVEEVVAEDTVLDIDKVLQRFYKQESTRFVTFPAPKPGDVPFDVIFVHICSLSWDDLKVTGLENHPLWRRFDILLTRFNSASTYSGPAAIRIQRATCGQPTHKDLYSPAPEKCYLMDSLKLGGFETSLVLNHDGHFDNFLKLVQAQGHFNIPPLPLKGAVINQHAFDGTPVYEDISVLGRWLEERLHSSSPRMAMYYNTVSLHDGNHLAGVGAELGSRENFKPRLTKLLDDLDKFMENIELSGRRAVVAIVPEHGAALRGDKMQIAGLREIPSSAITLVPVGIKVIGANLKRAGTTLRINKPTSYLAVSQIVARLLENPPYNNGSYVPSEYVKDLLITPFVSQNEDVIMAGYKGRYYLRQDASEWIDYTDF